MFKLKLKDKYKYEKYTLIDEEKNELHGKIIRSKEDIIKDIVLLQLISTCIIAIIFHNIYYGIVFGLGVLTSYLYDALEKEKN